MSIGTNHVFSLFISGKSQAQSADQRLAVVSFKTTKDKVTGKESKRDSMCASIPAYTLTDTEVLSLRKHVQMMFEKAQDGICRDAVIAGKASVSDDEISFAAVSEYLDAESEGSRLTKESVLEWFKATIEENLTASLELKLGVQSKESITEKQALQLTQAINKYRECYVALAGGKKTYAPEPAGKLLEKLAECAPENDEIANRFAARLMKMTQTVDDLI